MKKLKKFLRALGPGFITGAADDDPSGIATYSQTGALFGYAQLWTALFSTPLMTAVQEMVGRIGLVTGKGLGNAIREHYPKRVLYVAVSLLLVANTINIGANLSAMASSLELTFKLPFIFWLLVITAGTLILEVFIPYKTYAKYLKYLTLSLFSYVLAAFVMKQDWTAVFHAMFVPHVSLTREYLMNIVAIFGTTISPYLFFWQADEEVEEEISHHVHKAIERGEKSVIERWLAKMRLDTAIGMFFSNLIMFFIIATAASTLHSHGITNVATAADAAEALRPLAGDFTFFLFTVGIIGTGLLSVPILAGSASYALSEAIGWKVGLYRKFTHARGFYGVITAATLLGLLVNLTPLQPFTMLYYTAVINGLAAPLLLFLIVRIASNPRVMGQYISSRRSKALGWITTGVMAASAAALLATVLLS